METLRQDVRFALRTLRKYPGTTIVAVCCLALGIGANTAIYSVFRAVLLESLPYREPARLIVLNETFLAQGSRSPGSVSPLNFYDFRDQNRVLDGLAAYTMDTRDLRADGDPERVTGVRVSANLFSLLGARPLRGRAFESGEDQPGSAPVVMLAEGFWRRRFGANEKIVGSTITLSDRPYTVIGVMPSSFDFPIRVTRNDYWIPLVFRPSELKRGNHWLLVIGRLKAGVDSAAAVADLAQIAGRIARDFPNEQDDRGIQITRLDASVVGRVRPALRLLFGAVGVVLLIACANVANLLLARAVARRREVALRTALGADRGRLVRQLLTESVVLALAGGALGVVVGRVGLWAMKILAANSLPRADAIRLDGSVLAFIALLSLATGIVFGIIPALRASTIDLRQDLSESAGRGSVGRRQHRTLRVLIAGEIALSVVLLAGAGLLVRAFVGLLQTETGFKAEHVVTFRVSAPTATVDTMRFENFYAPVLDRLRALPGVRAVGTINMLPIQNSGMNGYFNVVGRPEEPDPARKPFAEFRIVSNDYFRAMSIPVVAGREFDARDTRGSAPVLLINDEFAKRYFKDEDPIGKQIKPWSDTPATIVGVVRAVRQRSIDRPPSSEIYVAAAQSGQYLSTSTVVISVSGNDDAILSAIPNVVRSVAPQPVYQLQTMEGVVKRSLDTQRLVLVLLGLFAALAVLLSAAGVYGVMSYAVTQRTREIGIRMAIGARRSEVVSMVLREGASVAAAGIAIGLLAAAAMTKLLTAMLYGISPRDPATFGAIAALIAAIAVGACVVPALRASRIDPIRALRIE